MSMVQHPYCTTVNWIYYIKLKSFPMEYKVQFDDLVQDSSNSSVLALELL